MEKQEKAFTAWLNHLLTPQPLLDAAPEDGCGDPGLAARRLEARTRGLIWHLYCTDPSVINVMTLLEQRIDKGFLRLKDEVGRSSGSGAGHLPGPEHQTSRCTEDASGIHSSMTAPVSMLSMSYWNCLTVSGKCLRRT